VDLSNDMTGWQMIAVGVRRLVLARGELAGEVTSELQVVGKAASIAIQTWVRNDDKTKARAEEREKNIGWTKLLRNSLHIVAMSSLARAHTRGRHRIRPGTQR